MLPDLFYDVHVPFDGYPRVRDNLIFAVLRGGRAEVAESDMYPNGIAGTPLPHREVFIATDFHKFPKHIFVIAQHWGEESFHARAFD
jgi:hypothetical protein